MDFTPGNQPSRPSLLSAAHSPRRATPQFPNTRGAHSAPGLRKPRGAGGEVPRVRGALRLTPPRSPRIVSGTSRPPRRGLPGAGCRRQAPLPPRGPSLLIMLRGRRRLTGPQRVASPRTLPLGAHLLCPAPSPEGRSQSWRRSSGISRQTCPMSAASLSAPPTKRRFRAKCKDQRKPGDRPLRLRSCSCPGEFGCWSEL